MTFAEDIEEAVGKESIQAIVIGKLGDHWEEPSYDSRNIPRSKCVLVLNWEEARPLLNYEYDDGFGGADCHAIYVWTRTRVFFVSEYDGATGIASVPRNPIDVQPKMQ
ncbi:hypothetical protein LCGC14_1144250 [marine sediment metagenome]|uniref:Uncharacterized protein n=1 Tax=marine sediment metagenome TaxID=412755 RepID=A0A0F9M293_9ZZZZ